MAKTPFPKVNLKQLELERKRNTADRIAFLDSYVEWLKKTKNKNWSRQQNKLLNPAPA